MILIGIINNKSNKIVLENMLKKNDSLDSFKIVSINRDNFDNFCNIKFDLLIINYEFKYDEKYREMLNNSSSILVNSDVKIDSNLFYEINAYVISYGFNKRATVTIVSCEQDELILDIQREINGLNNIKIDSGEIKVLVNYPKRYLYEGVVCEIVRKIYGYF